MNPEQLRAKLEEAGAKAIINSQATDDEGQFPVMLDLLGFSGENKSRTVCRQAAKDALTAILAAADKAGWQLVPREPRREMWAAMADQWVKLRNRHHDIAIAAMWKQGLAAAPSLLTAGDGE